MPATQKETKPKAPPKAPAPKAPALVVESIKRIPFDQLEIREGFNARDHESDEFHEGIAALATDLEESGLLNSLVVRPKKGAKDRYEITAGHRRYAAIARVRLTKPDFLASVPCIVRNDDDERAEATMIADFHSKPLTWSEAATRIREMLDRGMSKERIAAKTGKSLQMVENWLLAGTLSPEVQGLIDEGKIAGTEAVKAARSEGAEVANVLLPAAVKHAEKAGRNRATQTRDIAPVREEPEVAEAIARAKAKAPKSSGGPGRRPGPVKPRAESKPTPDPYKDALKQAFNHIDKLFAAVAADERDAARTAAIGLAKWMKAKDGDWSLIANPRYPAIYEQPASRMDELIDELSKSKLFSKPRKTA